MSTEYLYLSVAEEARADYARTVRGNATLLADYDGDALRRATYEQSVIRRRAEAEQKHRNGTGGDYTYVNSEGHTVKVDRLGSVLRVAVVNDKDSGAWGLIRLPDSAAVGLAASILAHSGHDHLAAALQAGVQ